MRILLVEDQEEKRKVINDYVREVFPAVDLSEAHSYFDAKNALRTGSYDLVLLDMSLPIYAYDSNHPSSLLVYGGEELLAWADERGLQIDLVVITQFDFFADPKKARGLNDLRKVMEVDYAKFVKATIYYQDTDVKWQAALREIISSLEIKK